MSFLLLNGTSTILVVTFGTGRGGNKLHPKLYRLAFLCLPRSHTKWKPPYVLPRSGGYVPALSLRLRGTSLHSAKGGAVETGCIDLYGVIHIFTI